MKLMEYWKILVAVGIVSYFLACSPVKFSQPPVPDCRGTGVSCIKSCEGDVCIEEFTDTKTVGNGMADILIVNDNSGSMSTEQAHMGSKFPTFISSLGATDYRIGMITTDVSSRVSDTRGNVPAAPNGNGKFQDGNLIEFQAGTPYLEPSTPNATSLFNTAVRRKETLACEQADYDRAACPSSDERGIFAANLAIARNEGGFLRPTAPLSLIFLADEDVRSGFYSGGPANTGGNSYGFDLQDLDQPATLVAKFKEKYPNKSISAHSIIIKSGDSSCLQTQVDQGKSSDPNKPSNPYVSGSYGLKYAELSGLTGGVIGSICSTDYGKELGKIASAIQNQVTSMAFVCHPIDDDFEVTFEPKLSYSVNAVADFDRLVVEFDKELPANTKITLSYSCEKL